MACTSNASKTLSVAYAAWTPHHALTASTSGFALQKKINKAFMKICFGLGFALELTSSRTSTKGHKLCSPQSTKGKKLYRAQPLTRIEETCRTWSPDLGHKCPIDEVLRYWGELRSSVLDLELIRACRAEFSLYPGLTPLRLQILVVRMTRRGFSGLQGLLKLWTYLVVMKRFHERAWYLQYFGTALCGEDSETNFKKAGR